MKRLLLITVLAVGAGSGCGKPKHMLPKHEQNYLGCRCRYHCPCEKCECKPKSKCNVDCHCDDEILKKEKELKEALKELGSLNRDVDNEAWQKQTKFLREEIDLIKKDIRETKKRIFKEE